MVKPIVLVIATIPAILAILIAIPLITQSEIPYSASNSNDVIEIEYAKYQLKKISFGVTERVGAQKTEILLIKNNGEIKYSVTENSYPKPDVKSFLDEQKLRKLKALIKETGFISIPSESFPIRENVTDFQKSNIKVTLNGRINQINWPEQNATDKFIPPIISMVESQLDNIVEQIGE
ncbi:MAG: hypothetical protein COV65_06595 [Nitrosopumilales archaeon CG11_big_fil_rev_8_21_14_0_20_33_24]|nr:MAG: hypothetical protein COV65_06595 [Nitrosopumilales archaeon CG11_big_fil_rev_8_21_14_0_20_33_24]PIY90586.1 MAG: hypothetical protein COY74_00565 [Nitrosopumilales archaeon CG_4_10_14_0_8_um_filter_34_8]PJB98227.1 MAG: hypothetical protein CO079_03110 [Nitrosopumilales archaeon CG_4_9_14_0_8_um_filter_34_10]